MSSPPRRLTNERAAVAEVDPLDLPLDRHIIPRCRVCRDSHPLRMCPEFRKMRPRQRLQAVKRHRYCINCLAHSHFLKECRSRERCFECLGEHHTMLHIHDNDRRRTDSLGPSSSRRNSHNNSVEVSRGRIEIRPRNHLNNNNRSNNRNNNRKNNRNNNRNNNNNNGGNGSRGSNPTFVFHFH